MRKISFTLYAEAIEKVYEPNFITAMMLRLRRTLVHLPRCAPLRGSVLYSATFIIAVVSMQFSSCSSNIEKILPVYNADTTSISVSNGIYYHNNQPFTGELFALYKSGDTIFSNEYFNGKENGWCKKWYSNHQLAEARFFANGKKEGSHTAYFANGNKKFDYHLRSDMFEGLQQEWFDNGKLYSKRNYAAGYETGLQQAWDSTGKIIINYEAINGRNYGNIGKKNCRSLWNNDSFAVAH